MGTEEPGDLHVGVVMINVADVDRAARFWCAAVGYRVREPELDREFAIIQPVAGSGLPIGLQRVGDTARQPVRLHPDLCTDDPDGQIDRLLQLGAVTLAALTGPGGAIQAGPTPTSTPPPSTPSPPATGSAAASPSA